MANPSASLARRVSWPGVVQAFDLDDSALTLPACIVCPACKKLALWVYKDNLVGGQWVHCRQCHFAGDMIELAAKFWKVDIRSAAVLLQGRDALDLDFKMIDGAVANYKRDHLDYRQRIAEFWQRTKNELTVHEPHTLPRLQREIWLNANDPSWTANAWRVGCTSPRQVDELFHPGSVAPRLRLNSNGKKTLRGGSGAGGRRIFRGHGWEQLIVIPFEDLPGRISGLLFIPDVEYPKPEDFVFKSVQLGWSRQPLKESGLAMLAAAFYPPSTYVSNSVFIFDDVDLAMRLQFRWLLSHSRPLPIVACIIDEKHQARHACRYLPYSRILCVREVTSSVLAMARATRAKIACFMDTNQNMIESRWRGPDGWLRHMEGLAVSWDIALRRKLHTLPLDAAERLLMDGQFGWNDLEVVLEKDHRGLEHKLQPILGQPAFQPQIVCNGKCIREGADGWYLQPSNRQICNAKIIVEQIAHAPAKRVLLRGHVTLQGQQIAFEVDQAE